MRRFEGARVGRGIIALACMLLWLPMLAGCHRTPDEEQVRQAISTAAEAARNNDADGLLEQVSKDFIGNEGDFDRRDLQRFLALRAFRHDSTGVLVGPISVKWQGERLLATFTLTLAGGDSGGLLPDHAAVYAMTTAWRREGSHWRCYSADWSNNAR
ncbi:MAG TPA: hypothetical protein VFK08_00250 [Rhodanobacteraceae bacterium]|nr:hypothetical protein [Rhodanobacteraceae bacterium]